MFHAQDRQRNGPMIDFNRSHVAFGEAAYILPCLGRTESDDQASGPQVISIEDSTACIHGSNGRRARDLIFEIRDGDRGRLVGMRITRSR
jgi:hypothetical protein